MKTSFYETVSSIVKSTPNNMELGNSIRSLVNKIQDSESKPKIAPNQITIFDEIKERQNDIRS